MPGKSPVVAEPAPSPSVGSNLVESVAKKTPNPTIEFPSRRAWDPGLIAKLAVAGPGGEVRFELTSAVEAAGRVRYIKEDLRGISYVTGELSEPEPGRFFFQKQGLTGVAGEFVGVVEFPASEKAYRIEPTGPGGASELVERRVSEVLCLKFPTPGKAGTNRVENIPPLSPSDYPDLPVPIYQNGVVTLESLHGAEAVLYLDFQGGYTPTWGGVHYERPNATKDQIREIWERVSEDFLPFNINVTTDLRVYQRATEGSRQRVIITPTAFNGPESGGVAYSGSFNWGGDTPCWVFLPPGKACAEACSHELGHTLGLSHEGQILDSGPSEYYNGHGTGDLAWAPIMGVAYGRPISQWSKGDYENANNKEDQIAIITTKNNGVTFRVDDTGNTLATSRYLELYSNGVALAEGMIGWTADADSFQFTTGGGMMSLTARSARVGPNLALQVSLYDAQDHLLASEIPQDGLSASLSKDLRPGTYTFQVMGSGRGDPQFDGFSSYGSIGYYSITGLIANPRLPDRFSILEHATNGTFVGTVPVRNSSPGPFRYTLLTGNRGGTFAINDTGVLSVADNRLLEYDTLGRDSQLPVQFELFVKITDLFDSSLSETNRRVVVAIIDVPGPPVITQQPRSITVPAGTNLILSVTAVGSDPLQYQWYFNSQMIEGAFNSEMAITNAQLSNSGEYYALVNNSVGSVTSYVSVVTVVPAPPVILSQPQSQGTFPGFKAHFEVAVQGTAPFTFQWQLNGTNIQDGTGSELEIPSVGRENLGFYRVAVSNPYGTSMSAEALLNHVPVAAWGWNEYGQASLPLELTNTVAISAGARHNLALRQDGSVFSWGDTNQANVPSDLTGAVPIVAIAAGGGHNLAVTKQGGTLIAWGNSSNGQTLFPPGLTNVVAVAAGDKHSLALKTDGTVVACGLNSSGQAIVPLAVTNIVAIAAGSNHSLALRADGKVFAWGDNTFGQASVPTNLSDIIAISAGAAHSLALNLEGRVFSWGANDYQQLAPTSGLSNVTAIAGGGYHNLALRKDGTVVAWGAGKRPDSQGSLQQGQAQVPSAVSNITCIAGGLAHSLALAGDGAPFIVQPPVGRIGFIGRRQVFRVVASGTFPLSYQWQFNGEDIHSATNQLLVLDAPLAAEAGKYRVRVTNAFGEATTDDVTLTLRDAPPQVISQPQSQTAYLGGSAMLEMVMDGSGPFYYQWRFNGVDMPGATKAALWLDHLTFDDSGYYSVKVTTPLGVFSSNKALLTVAQVAVWGLSKTYRPYDYDQNQVPARLDHVIQLAGGASHALALRDDGTVVGWGGGSTESYGPLRSTYGQETPPADLEDVIAIAAGEYHSLALRRDGTVVAWGAGATNFGIRPHYGQSVVPSGLGDVVDIAAGETHSVAVKSDGTVVVWGGYNFGPSVTNIPAACSNIIAVSSCGYQIVALRADGVIISWGFGGFPGTRTGINPVAIAAGATYWTSIQGNGSVLYSGISPPKVSITDVCAGYTHFLGIKQDGSLVTWGQVQPELLQIPAGLTNVIAVGAGHYHSLAAVGDGTIRIKMHPTERLVEVGGQTALLVDSAGNQPITYQWQLNGATMADATNRFLRLTNVQFADAGNYSVIVSNIYGSVTSRTALVTVRLTLGQVLNSQLPWFSSGSGNWKASTNISHDGIASAQSGSIGDKQSSSLQCTVAGPGRLSFWWKVSSEPDFDYLTYSVDGTTQASISGERDWAQEEIEIGEGPHIVKWSYVKDASVGAGQDAGWVDEVQFQASPPIITTQPQDVVATGEQTVLLKVAAIGSPPLSYQWLKDGFELPDANQFWFSLRAASRADSGAYSVRVTNPGGSILSSNAQVRVRMPQQLGPPTWLPDGSLMFLSNDLDGNPFQADILNYVEALVSDDLDKWRTLTNSLVFTNGSLRLIDLAPTQHPKRFYRILER